MQIILRHRLSRDYYISGREHDVINNLQGVTVYVYHLSSGLRTSGKLENRERLFHTIVLFLQLNLTPEWGLPFSCEVHFDIIANCPRWTCTTSILQPFQCVQRAISATHTVVAQGMLGVWLFLQPRSQWNRKKLWIGDIGPWSPPFILGFFCMWL